MGLAEKAHYTATILSRRQCMTISANLDISFHILVSDEVLDDNFITAAHIHLVFFPLQFI